MKKTPRVYSPQSIETVRLLGKRIKLERKERGWSEHALAERAGISRVTLQKIEKGDLSCAIGLVFELAALVGIQLFASDQASIQVQHTMVDGKIALLPRSMRNNKQVVDDDF